MTNFCLYCGNELVAPARARRGGRQPEFCNGAHRVAHHRRVKRYNQQRSMCNVSPSLKGQLVLELFPGAGLLGKTFEALGACVVRGPDILWGGDVRELVGISGRFDGIIGGPPCQVFSRAAIRGTDAINLIPEFTRLVKEFDPKWAVMENVREALAAAPQWDYVFLRDWDCGGFTHRRRGFWFYGMDAPPAPEKREGNPEYSVLASNWNRRGVTRLSGHLWLSPFDAARLQGFPDLAERIINAQPGWKSEKGGYKGVNRASRWALATHMMGNGVPKAMGQYVAEHVAYTVAAQSSEVRLLQFSQAGD